MEIEELEEIVDLAVEKWHKVADDHDIKHCNCFREEFSKAMEEKYKGGVL